MKRALMWKESTRKVVQFLHANARPNVERGVRDSIRRDLAIHLTPWTLCQQITTSSISLATILPRNPSQTKQAFGRHSYIFALFLPLGYKAARGTLAKYSGCRWGLFKDKHYNKFGLFLFTFLVTFVTFEFNLSAIIRWQILN